MTIRGFGIGITIESTGAPAPSYYFDDVTGFTATVVPSTKNIQLAWTNPINSNFLGVVIRHSITGYPTSPTDGDLVYNASGTNYLHTDVDDGITHYYTIFAYDIYGTYSAGVTENEFVPDITAPGPITGFSATPSAETITLTWTNPTDVDFAGVIIRRSESGYPATPTEGDPVYDGTGTFVEDSGLDSTKIYYYSAFTYDAEPNYSPVAQTAAQPLKALVLTEVGLIEAITRAFGKIINDIAGLRLTRTTMVVNAGVTTIPVESTLDWSDSGKVAIDGIVYYYSSKTLYSLLGITHVANGLSVTGTKIQHRIASVVTYLNRDLSTIDIVRRSFLTDYAEGEDLDINGRNLAVLRQRYFSSEDQYRNLIQAVAYNPKGTILGLTLALEALVGAGNFTIYEDLIEHPNTIFFQLPETASITEVSAGKAFLTDAEYQVISGSQDTIVLNEAPITVQGITLADIGELFDFRSETPNATTYDYYPGASTPGDAFDYSGVETEGTAITLVSGQYTQMASTGNSAFFTMPDTKGARVDQESTVIASQLIYIPDTATVQSTTQFEQCGIEIHDGAYKVGVGINALDASRFTLGIYRNTSTFLTYTTVALNYNTWYDITIKKIGTDRIQLYVNGTYIGESDYINLTTPTTDHKITFGLHNPLSGMVYRIKQLAINIHNTKDYYNARKSTGSVATANPNQLTDATFNFLTEDIGRQVQISNSTITNTYGGKNNGIYKIASLIGASPTQTIELEGATKYDAELSSSNPTRITLPREELIYPDDLGKKIVISGSSLGNDGTYVIDTLLNPGTFENLATGFDTSITTRTNVCEVVSASFVSESNLYYEIAPNFETESLLFWELADASTLTDDTITLRQSIWVNNLLMKIITTDVLSAQIMGITDILNSVISTSPLLYEYYPFYIADPLSLFRAYLDDLTAGGVIPEYEFII